MSLHLDPTSLNACVQCGLCLPHCPTYRVTGDDARSPRGRIGLMRAVVDGAPITEEVVASMQTCVQCRGCEPACPSAVPFGALIADTRAQIVGQGTIGPRWLRAALWPLGRPRLLRLGTLVLAGLQRARIVPSARIGIPKRLPLRRPELASTGSDVWLFTGCVQDAWMSQTHVASLQVLSALGIGAELTGDDAPCCGALHHHGGFVDEGLSLGRRVVEVLAGDERPIVVSSAGCGAELLEHPELKDRVVDISAFVAPRVDELAGRQPLPLRVAVQDPCHLRHVQRNHLPVRDLLGPLVAELVELDDDGLCCGAGGAYSLLEADLANDIRDRKLGALERAKPDVVASANPGCALHLAGAGVQTRHPIELVADYLGQPSRS